MELIVPTNIVSDIASSTHQTVEGLWPIYVMVFIVVIGFYCLEKLIVMARDTI